MSVETGLQDEENPSTIYFGLSRDPFTRFQTIVSCDRGPFRRLQSRGKRGVFVSRSRVLWAGPDVESTHVCEQTLGSLRYPEKTGPYLTLLVFSIQ